MSALNSALGLYADDATALKHELEQRQLAMVGAFVPVALKNVDAHTAGEAMRCKWHVYWQVWLMRVPHYHSSFLPMKMEQTTTHTHAGRVTTEMGLTADEWKTFAQGRSASHAPYKMKRAFHRLSSSLRWLCGDA